MTSDLKTFLLQSFQSWTFCPEKKKNRKRGRWGCIWNQDAGLKNGFATCLKRGLIQPLRPVPTPLQWVCAHIFCPDISVLHPENENMQGHIQPVAITSSDTTAAAAAAVWSQKRRREPAVLRPLARKRRQQFASHSLGANNHV